MISLCSFIERYRRLPCVMTRLTYFYGDFAALLLVTFCTTFIVTIFNTAPEVLLNVPLFFFSKIST